jgi:hypothetical protein
MSHPDVTIARQTFTFDGATLNSANASVPVTAPPAGPGADVLRWLGRHPFGVFDDMSERARFATIMPAGEISALANHVQVANSTFQQGDWVIGLGCLPQLCDSSRGVWGLRISDGAAGAAILGPNGAGTLYGLAATDPTLRQVPTRTGPVTASGLDRRVPSRQGRRPWQILPFTSDRRRDHRAFHPRRWPVPVRALGPAHRAGRLRRRGRHGLDPERRDRGCRGAGRSRDGRDRPRAWREPDGLLHSRLVGTDGDAGARPAVAGPARPRRAAGGGGRQPVPRLPLRCRWRDQGGLRLCADGRCTGRGSRRNHRAQPGRADDPALVGHGVSGNLTACRRCPRVAPRS